MLQLLFTALKLEVTPFLLYGMYSEKQTVPETIVLRTVYLDSLPLQNVAMPARERDLLLTGVENYLALKANGGVDGVQTRVEQRYPFFTNSTVYPFVDKKIYNTAGDTARFEVWFKQKCSGLIKQEIKKVTVVETRYTVTPPSFAPKRAAREAVTFF